MDYDFNSIICDLKPCPFCGGKAEMYSSYQNHGMDGSCRNIVIKCSNCFASMTFAADRFYGREISTPDDMKNRWNRRVQND